jgi:cell division septum initiation protein DivIVA
VKTAENPTAPKFAHAVRGYDRIQVDEYVYSLSKWVSGAQIRAQQAERLAVERQQEIRRLVARVQDLEAGGAGSHDAALREVAERCASALDSATQEASSLRSNAAAQAQEVIAAAERQSREMVEVVRSAIAGLGEASSEERRTARQRAEAIIEDATAEADTIIRAAEPNPQRSSARPRRERAGSPRRRNSNDAPASRR